MGLVVPKGSKSVVSIHINKSHLEGSISSIKFDVSFRIHSLTDKNDSNVDRTWIILDLFMNRSATTTFFPKATTEVAI